MDIFQPLRELEKKIGRTPRVGLIGLGKTNSALLSALLGRGYEVTVRSDAPVELAEGVRGCFSDLEYADISEDVLLFSPSVRRDSAELSDARRRGAIFSSDCELFFEGRPDGVFAVSGSDGKSTTCALAAALLSDRFGEVEPACNFGTPFVSLSENRVYAVELSSFNLQYLEPRVRRGAITNITPNHLNWHKDMQEYTEAKLKLLRGAIEPILCADDPLLLEYAEGKSFFAATSRFMSEKELSSRVDAQIYYSVAEGKVMRNGEVVMPLSDLGLSGEYNISNLLTALAITDGYRDPLKDRETVRGFRGLRHRASVFTDRSGRKYINSSIDTTPSRTCATLRSIGGRVGVILGGRGKGLPLDGLCEALRTHSSAVGLYGEEGERMLSAFAGLSVPLALFGRMEEAVDFVANACAEDVVLSPGATAYGLYRDFEERGCAFEEYVKNKTNT